MSMRKRIVLIIIILVLTTTIAYSGLATSLAITSDVTIRAKADIRITNVKLEGTNNGALIEYESKYTKDAINFGFTLPNDSSSIIYKITIQNKGEVNYSIYNIINELTNSEGLYFEISGYSIKDVIEYKSTIDLYITFKTNNPGNNVINSKVKLDFRKVFTVSYDTNGSDTLIKNQIKYENEDLIITNNIPERIGYAFMGWSDIKDDTNVKYNSGDLYKIDKDIILYAVWKMNNFEIILDSIGAEDIGTNKLYGKYKDSIYLDANLNNSMTSSSNPISIPSKYSYIFTGYYTKENAEGVMIINEHGYLVENSIIENKNDITLYASYRKITASDLYYKNGGLGCTDNDSNVQCALDKLNEMLGE